MRNIKLIIEYDGTRYSGWQSQINANSIQDEVTAAIRKITGEENKLTGSSRTDAGVHAIGYTANFYTESPIPAEKFSYVMNTVLPDDIVVTESCEVEEDFHSRFSALRKKYRYLIYNSEHPSALLRNRVWHIRKPIDVDSMKKACEHFIGEHDFTSFKAAGSPVIDNVRRITEVDLKKEDNMIVFEITGDGFLYKMVRIIVGTLVEVGIGKISPDDIPKIIKSKDRNNAGKTAPPQGLYLVKVWY